MLIFYFMLIMSSMMISMCNLWMNMWIFLEINLISFIYLNSNNKNYSNMESNLIYFIIQTIASIIFFFSLIMEMNYMMNLMMIALFIKMGLAPFHYWLIMMCNKLNYKMLYILLTWQKIGPLMLFMEMNNKSKIIYFILLSSFIGSLSGLNYSSLKKIITYSSINQMSWLSLILMFNMKIFKLYFLMYLFMLYSLMLMFNNLYLFNLVQMYKYKKNNHLLMYIFSNLLSLGGLPPLMGFFPKMMVIMMMHNYFIMFYLILITLITLFYYIRIMISFLFINSLKLNIMKYNLKMNMMMKISNLNNLILMLLILIY